MNYVFYHDAFISIIYITTFVCIQLDFKPADIKHSSLRTMAKHVRRAMLPGNHEVFQRSFAEGNALPNPSLFDLPLMLHHGVITLPFRVGWKAGSGFLLD